MKKKIIHKLDSSPSSEDLKLAYCEKGQWMYLNEVLTVGRWNKVTCKRCLKQKKKSK